MNPRSSDPSSGQPSWAVRFFSLGVLAGAYAGCGPACETDSAPKIAEPQYRRADVAVVDPLSVEASARTIATENDAFTQPR